MKNKLLHVLMLTSALSVTSAFANEMVDEFADANPLPNQAGQILLPPNDEDDMDAFAGAEDQEQARTVLLTEYNQLFESHIQLQNASQEQIDELTEELNDLKGNLARLRETLDTKESELEAQTSVISALRANVAELQAANAQWAAAYSKLKEKQKTATPINPPSARRVPPSTAPAGSTTSTVPTGSNRQDLDNLALTGASEQSGSGRKPSEDENATRELTKEDKIQFIVRNMPRDRERTKKINDLTFTVSEKALERMYQSALADAAEDEEETTA